MTSKELQVFIEKEQDAFIKSISGIDKELYKAVIDIILDHTHEGKFLMSDNDLATLEDDIYDALKNGDYNKIVNNYLALFEIIESKIVQQQADINHFKAGEIKELFKGSQGRTVLKDRIIYDLKEQGLKTKFVKTIADMIRNEAIFSKTSKEVVKLFESQIEKGNVTEKYVRSVAVDALNEYHGTLNQEIKVKYGLTKIKYIGNLVDHSRPICTEIMNKYGGRIEDDQLKKLLEEYCPGGIPSEEMITFKDHNGKEHTMKKGSGIKKGTTFENFCTNCGGYECRHIAIPVRRF